MSKKKILIIAAHPDDEILGAFSYMNNNDYETQTIFVCEGSSARFMFRESSNLLDEAIASRQLAALSVAKVLKNNPPIFLNFVNLTLASLPIIEINQKIEPLIQSFKPNIIITHTKLCNNSDHAIVSNSVNSVVRSNKYPNVELILNMEIPSSTEQLWGSNFTPNHFVTLNDIDIERKIDLLSLYGDELQNDPGPRSAFGIRAYAAFRGVSSGSKYAESFRIMRSISRNGDVN
jgi:LmbE family N-acetylglucosaminyl deacetylase